MLRVLANDAHHAFAVDHLAFITHFFYRRPDFHNCLLLISIRYATTAQVVWRKLDKNFVARQDAYEELPHFA